MRHRNFEWMVVYEFNICGQKVKMPPLYAEYNELEFNWMDFFCDEEGNDDVGVGNFYCVQEQLIAMKRKLC